MIILIGTFVLGFIVGTLLYRNNITKLQNTEEKSRKFFDKLKGLK